MPAGVDELWSVARRTPQVDAAALARAIENAAEVAPLDYRTRLLVRDGVRALRSHWGPDRLDAWLRSAPRRAAIEQICESMRPAADDEGFPSLTRRIVDAIKPEAVEQMLRELSAHVTRPTRLMIGGSIALTMSGHLLRHTEDLDVVDEVPAELRSQHALLDELTRRYGLRLTHFQSHYLPSGWAQRVRSLGAFGKLQVFVVDPYDVVVGKLFSNREKDRDDLRAVVPQLDRDVLVGRLAETSAPFRADPKLLAAAERNWFVVFGEPLPG